jgi:hypothetical protein
LRDACQNKADADQDHAEQRDAARTDAVGEGPAQQAEREIKKAGQRKHQRYRAARGAEFALQHVDEGAERIDAAEPDKRDGETAGDDQPAVKQTRCHVWIGRFLVDRLLDGSGFAHGRLLFLFCLDRS